jgi:hypothetical protein
MRTCSTLNAKRACAWPPGCPRGARRAIDERGLGDRSAAEEDASDIGGAAHFAGETWRARRFARGCGFEGDGVDAYDNIGIEHGEPSPP